MQTATITPNRLNSVNNVTGTYSYDANGNATTYGRNGMSLTYNNLNLPATANKAGTGLTYTYNAAGQKLSKNYNGSIRSYVEGIEYNGNTIDVIHTEEGLARNNGGTYTYQYNLSDHLGNVRYTFDIYNGAVRRLQQDDYYAFGKRRSVSPVSTDNKYLYNGKEVQDELGEQYDYGARFYDPVIGRWNVVDPLAELDRKTTPYAYAFDDPIRHTDPDGMFGEDVNEDFGQEEGPKPKPKEAVSAAGAATVAGAVWRTLAAIGEGIEIVGTGAATAVAGTVALVFLPTEAGRGSDRPPSSFFPPPPIPPKFKDDAKAKQTTPETSKKQNRRADAEHTSTQSERTRNKHENGRARKDKEQAKADEKYSNTKSTKKDTRSNNQKKIDNPDYKRTGPKTE